VQKQRITECWKFDGRRDLESLVDLTMALYMVDHERVCENVHICSTYPASSTSVRGRVAGSVVGNMHGDYGDNGEYVCHRPGNPEMELQETVSEACLDVASYTTPTVSICRAVNCPPKFFPVRWCLFLSHRGSRSSRDFKIKYGAVK
jgi:hypothetical protein